MNSELPARFAGQFAAIPPHRRWLQLDPTDERLWRDGQEVRQTRSGLSAIQSPRKPNGLSHCIFECLIVEASSQAQNHFSVLADRYTEWCRGVFDCTGDG